MGVLHLSAAKAILLVAHLAAAADIDGLAYFAAQDLPQADEVLRHATFLRILLTYLPATVPTSDYVSFVKEISDDNGITDEGAPRDFETFAADLTEEEAARKVRKLRLKKLEWPDAPADANPPGTTALFLVQRAYYVDEHGGALYDLPDLIVPFLDEEPALQAWVISVLLPFVRRHSQYHVGDANRPSLYAFERLPDRAAVTHLLGRTGAQEQDLPYVGRDLRGLIGPWLYNEARWTSRSQGQRDGTPKNALQEDVPPDHETCPGWEQVTRWLTAQAASSWRVAVCAIDQWEGPGDVDLGDLGTMWLGDEEQEYMEQRYAQAALASAYLIPEESEEALNGAYTIVTRIMGLLDQGPSPQLQAAASMLSPIPHLPEEMFSSRNAIYLRNGLLDNVNQLTKPSKDATQLLSALTQSAYLLTRVGLPRSIRKVGELALLQDEREQKAEVVRLLRAYGDHAQNADDKYWIRVRNEVLWLRDWGAEEGAGSSVSSGQGIFGQVPKAFLDIEILKTLLTNARYTLARALYEDSTDSVVPEDVLQSTICTAAMDAYDNASNPNRTRGGLKKCNDIINSFPKTVPRSSPSARRIEALLKATHALSDYRLVLKKGEPFTPIRLRVNSDPVSIITKVLEQNSHSYTHIQDLLELGRNLVRAGLTARDKSDHTTPTPDQEAAQLSAVERRVTAMCIDAALGDDDFETAYSYVVNRVAVQDDRPSDTPDEWSWKAALQTGKYRRTERTVRPTHLGTASGNPEIRHLEQRIECLAAALRIAPSSALQEILNTFRRCEEELDSAILAEAEQENAWDAAADMHAMPGGFGAPAPATTGVLTSRAAAASGSSGGRPHTEEAPLSLFDLSRATALAASRNFASLASLQRSGQNRASESPPSAPPQQHQGGGRQAQAEAERVRKRDQLANAAMGTLTSGVGWLIGAQPVDRGQ